MNTPLEDSGRKNCACCKASKVLMKNLCQECEEGVAAIFQQLSVAATQDTALAHALVAATAGWRPVII